MASTPLYAPGSLVIRQVARVTYSGSPGSADYAIYFFPCADVRMHFGHVSELDQTILSEVGAFSASDCAEPYTVSGVTVQPCTKNVSISLAAGTPLGTQRGTMNWGATDRRQTLSYVNAARLGGGEDGPYGQNHVVCPVDWNERLHLGLVRDYLDPSIAAFSVGTSIPSLPTDLYRFDPVDVGRVDRDLTR